MSKLPVNYFNILARLKEQIQNARLKATISANKVLLQLYWEIGTAITEMQQTEGWGAKVIDRLSADLKMDFPDFKGLSVRNLKYMVRFAKTFPSFGQQAAAQNQADENQLVIIGQQAAAQLPWGHLQVLMDKVPKTNEMLFYTQKCLENGWSRNILVEQINSGLFYRQGQAITNFSRTLPAIQSDLAQQSLKNPYLFDFISLGDEIHERDMENALIQHLKLFMLELGRGFAYIGRQKNLVVEGDDFFLDLLFYNYILNCFVVFELKVGDFKPEYAGKLNFYVNAINEQVKGPDHKPTIGVLLCKTPNQTVVRYSLQTIKSPIGVAEYKLAESLPKQLKGEIPTVEELESEMEKEYEKQKKPIDKKLGKLKDLLKDIKQPEARETKNIDVTKRIFEKVILPLREKILIESKKIEEYFNKIETYVLVGNRGFRNIDEASQYLKEEEKYNSWIFEVKLYAHGFIKAGVNAFSCQNAIEIKLHEYKYQFVFIKPEKTIDKLYDQIPNDQEFNDFAEIFIEEIIENINQNLERIKKDIK